MMSTTKTLRILKNNSYPKFHFILVGRFFFAKVFLDKNKSKNVISKKNQTKFECLLDLLFFKRLENINLFCVQNKTCDSAEEY